jgi:hypothetical protein
MKLLSRWAAFVAGGCVAVAAVHAQVPAGNDTSDGNFNTGSGTGALGGPAASNSGSANSAFGKFALSGNGSGSANSAFGATALGANTSGNNNTAAGSSALFANTTGSNNTASGSNALYLNTTGSNNTVSGAFALYQNQTASYNTASGGYVLYSNTTGGFNTASGYKTLYSNTTGSSSTAAGFQALYSSTSGYENTATGTNSLYFNSTGYENTATGAESLYYNTTGSKNVALGYDALNSNTTGYANSATGFQALYLNTTGYYNFGDGVNALYSNTTGNLNTAFGVSALYSNTTGSYNIGEGYHGGYNLTTGSNNIDIANAGVAAESGIIRIGTAGTQTAAYIAGISSSQITGAAVYVTAAGQLGVLASSERYKTAIASLGPVSEKLDRLRRVSFHLKTEPRGAVQYGLIAEEVETVYPELVIRDAGGVIQGVRYDELAPLLLNELQAERRRMSDLQQRVTKQDALISAQATEISAHTAKFLDLTRQMAELKKANESVLAALRQDRNSPPETAMR